MANFLEQYGIKEVADVTMYEINNNNGAITYKPVLFLDTLKVSTIEQTAEQTEARGGKGNSPLIVWDFGKEITISIEDALYSPASMAIMFGAVDPTTSEIEKDEVTTITKMEKWIADVTNPAASTGGVTYKYYEASDNGMVERATTSEFTVNAVYYREATYTTAGGKAGGEKYVSGHTFVISASTFPGTYRLVGDTYARNRTTGKDEYFQFEIPQAKMSSEQTITLEAEGDPTVFSMNMTVLRPENDIMMKLTQYKIDTASAT